jgi:hypothetical protein
METTTRDIDAITSVGTERVKELLKEQVKYGLANIHYENFIPVADKYNSMVESSTIHEIKQQILARLNARVVLPIIIVERDILNADIDNDEWKGLVDLLDRKGYTITKVVNLSVWEIREHILQSNEMGLDLMSKGADFFENMRMNYDSHGYVAYNIDVKLQ